MLVITSVCCVSSRGRLGWIMPKGIWRVRVLVFLIRKKGIGGGKSRKTRLTQIISENCL